MPNEKSKLNKPSVVFLGSWMKINLIWKMDFLIGICQGLTVSQDTFPEENHAAIQERAADLSNVFLIQVSCSDRK